MAKNKKRAQKQPMADSSKMNNKDYLKALRELHVETVADSTVIWPPIP
jgi:hypothetical protein